MVLQWVEQKGKEKRSAGEKLGWATAHFNHQVMTQQVVSRHGQLGVHRASAHSRTVGSTISPTRTYDIGARRARLELSRKVVVTHFLVSQPGLVGLVSRHTFWCRDMVGLHGVATHLWCCDTEATGRAIFMSRHTFWCCDMV